MPQKQKMRFSSVAFAAALTLAFLVLPACGGGGNGFGGPQADLAVTNAVLPQFLSGNFVDYQLPIDGGCGGEYVVQVVDGVAPDDITFENRKVPNGDGTFSNALFVTGYLIEAGTFNWRLQITDTACTPFQSITQDFAWTVGEGPLVIVNANPALVPQDQLDVGRWEAAPGEPKIDGFKKTTYNQFVAISLIVAGGRGPYTCEVVDDPSDPNDSLLPQGVSMPPGSCSIVGSPVQVLAGGIPFLLTIEATDALGQKTRRKLQWKVDTPPIIVATTSLPDGTAGTIYNELFQFADGVPPFQVELMDTPGEPDFEQHTYDSPNLPTFPTTPAVAVNNTGASTNRLAGAYPAKDAPGPNYTPYPSEGMYLVDQGASTGSFTGVPRRVGTFDINLHVYSLLVPNERGQHGFQSYSFSIAPAATPVGMNTLTWTDETNPTPNTSAPYSTLPEISQGAVYNPDGGLLGLELVATGGVAFDGYTDAPHDSDRSTNGETAGDYRWDVDFDPDSNGAYDPLDPAIEMLSQKTDVYGDNYYEGRFGVTLANTSNTNKAAFKELTFTVKDEQLPNDPGQAWHRQNERTDRFRYSVGPDRVIVTESSVTATVTQTPSYGYVGMDYEFLKVRAFQVVAGIGSVSNLTSADLIGTIPSPATANGIANDDLGKLLSGTGGTGGDADLDLVRIVANPGGYWNDNGNINNENGSAGQKGDYSTGYMYTNEVFYNYGSNKTDNTCCFLLPYADGVTHSPSTGVYANGGQMYAFDSDNYFGFFIIRPDSKIYVPWATRKGAFNSFGDTMWMTRDNNRNSMMRSCQITVSPDGRLAAVEITPQSPTTSYTSTLAHVSTLPSSIVVFSLTGEKRWNGGNDTWNVIDGNTAGVTQTSSGYSSSTFSGYRGGKFLWAQSLTLTNDNLYYIIGNWAGTGSHWCDHYIMKAGISDTIGSATHTPVSGNWTQTASTPMQTPFNGVFHREVTRTQTNWNNTNSTFTGGRIYDRYVMLYDNVSYATQLCAPHPFRVNRAGTHCALLAGPRSPRTTSSADAMRHYAWVDTGTGFVQVSSNTNRWSPMGGSRGTTMRRGDSGLWDYHWGYYDGPTTGFEISDDGSKIAWVAYTNIGTTSVTSTSRYGSAQQEIYAATTTNNWATSSEVSVTATKFLGSMYWRFGSLVFTNDNNGLVFWGGYSGSSPTSSFQPSYSYVGTYYSYDFTNSTLKSCFDSDDGGGADDIKTYSTTNVSPSTTSRSGAGGNILPFAGFRSKSGDFFYIATEPAPGSGNTPTGTDRATGCQLLGINVSTLAAGNINGHANGEGFSLDYWPSHRGFLPKYYYAPYYSLNLNYYAPAHSAGYGKQVMAKDNGYVFFAAHYQRSTERADTSFGGASTSVRWQGYGSYGGRVYGFDSDIGGRINEISDASFTSDTSIRMIHYLDVSSDGSRVAYTYSQRSTYPGHDQERIGVARKISFTGANGALAPGMQSVLMEGGSGGRSGESLALDSTGTRVYYAFKTGSGGNENGKVIMEGVQDGAGAFAKTSYGSTARWSVLHSGR